MKHLIWVLSTWTLWVALACGRSESSRLAMIGGNLADVPLYVAGILDANEVDPSCGGSFIAADTVLTSAHCVATRQFALSVMAGSQFRLPAEQRSTIPVQSVTIHPDYNPLTGVHDVALLQLGSYRSAIAVEVLPLNQDTNFPDQSGSGIVALGGLGNISNFGGIYENSWRENTVTTIAPRQCRALLNGTDRARFSSAMMCIGNLRSTGPAFCDGDAGTPVVAVGGNGVPVQVGLAQTSSFEGCQGDAYPMLVTRASAYTAWIEDTIAQNRRTISGMSSDLVERIRRICYEPYRSLQDVWSGNGLFSHATTISPGLDWKVLDGSISGNPLGSPCAIAAGSGSVWTATLWETKNTANPFLYEVRGPAGEAYQLGVATHDHFLLMCHSPDLTFRFSPQQAVQQGRKTLYFENYLLYESDVMQITERSGSNFQSSPSDVVCKIGDYEARWKKGAKREKTLMRFAGPLMPQPLVFLTYPVNPTETPSFVLRTQGSFEWVVPGTVSIKSWDFSCRFPLAMELDGQWHDPVQDDDGWWHQRTELPNGSAVLPAGRSTFFRYRTPSPLTAAQVADGCRLNGTPVRGSLAP